MLQQSQLKQNIRITHIVRWLHRHFCFWIALKRVQNVIISPNI